jgi:hypothetical protein
VVTKIYSVGLLVHLKEIEPRKSHSGLSEHTPIAVMLRAVGLIQQRYETSHHLTDPSSMTDEIVAHWSLFGMAEDANKIVC